MTDVVQDLSEVIAQMENGIRNVMHKEELYPLLFRAIDEIERLRKANIDMDWRLNPDRMGGQFTEEEKNRTGWL
jgi:hypothetical protein